MIQALEPWCANVYCDFNISEYISKENTSFNLNDKFKPLDNEKQNEILIQIDGSRFTQDDFGFIQQMSEIIQDSGEEGFHGEIGNLVIDILKMNRYEKDLISCNSI